MGKECQPLTRLISSSLALFLCQSPKDSNNTYKRFEMLLKKTSDKYDKGQVLEKQVKVNESK